MSCSGWKEVKLGDIADVQTGPFGSQLHNSDYVDKGTPIITVEHLGERKLSHNSMPFVCEEDRVRLHKYGLMIGDLVFSRVGSVDRCSLISKGEDGWLFSGRCLRVRPHVSVLYPQYLYYYFCLENIKEYIRSIAVGATMPSINTKILSEVQITVPQIKVQKAIADTLSCLDDKIELNNRINKNLEEMAQAIFKSWFEDFEPFQDGGVEDSELGRIPKGWRVGTLDECIDFYNGHPFRSKDLLDCEVQECYHVFKMGHIKKGGGLNPEGTKSWIEKSNCKEIEKYVLKVGDLLMCMTDMKGNVALLGHTALMNISDKYIVNQRVGLIRANNDLGINFPYLYILTNSHDFIENLRGRANSGVQVNLSTNEIKASKIKIAPKEVNTKYNEVITPMFDKMFKIVNENQTLTSLRDTLLPKLMSGEIRVPIKEADNS